MPFIIIFKMKFIPCNFNNIKKINNLKYIKKINENASIQFKANHEFYNKIDSKIDSVIINIEGLGYWENWNGVISNTNNIKSKCYFQVSVPIKDNFIKIPEMTMLKFSSPKCLNCLKKILDIKDLDIIWKSKILD